MRLICVDATYATCGLAVGNEYERLAVDARGMVKVDCCELHSRPGDGFWYRSRFRPVRKTDISCFRAMLDTTKHKEPVG